jgi:hypothetical protein
MEKEDILSNKIDIKNKYWLWKVFLKKYKITTINYLKTCYYNESDILSFKKNNLC